MYILYLMLWVSEILTDLSSCEYTSVQIQELKHIIGIIDVVNGSFGEHLPVRISLWQTSAAQE